MATTANNIAMSTHLENDTSSIRDPESGDKIPKKMPVMADSCEQKAKDSNLLPAEKVIMVILCQFQKKGKYVNIPYTEGQ